MASSDINTSVNLGLSSTPKLNVSPEVYAEIINIYNAIRSLAIGVDDYTANGELLSKVVDLEAAIGVAAAIFKRGLKGLKQDLEEAPNNHAALFELRKQYYRYTVPKFTVNTDLNVKSKFSLGNPATKPPIGVQTITKLAGTAPTSGAGTTAGAFDTALTRDNTLAAIKANADAITEMQNFLKSFGFFQ